MAIAAVSAASSTSSNWLKEAQDALAASQTPGGMMGALQDSRAGYSIKTFLAKSQNNSYALAQIAQNAQTSSSALVVQMSQAAAKKRYDEQVALQVKLCKQLRALFFPSVARRGMYRIVTRAPDPLLQLNHAPELLTTADGAVHEKRAASCITLRVVWKVSTGKQAYHLVVHRLSPRIGSHLLTTIHPKGFSIRRPPAIVTPRARSGT